MYGVVLLMALTAGPELAVAQGPSYTEGGIPEPNPGGATWLSNYRDAGPITPAPVQPAATLSPSPQAIASLSPQATSAPAASSSELIPAPRAFVRGPVRINLRVPADAEVRIDGSSTTQRGEFRQFVSPPVLPGREYHYEVRASWKDGGRTVERSRRIIVHAGDLVNLDLTQPGALDQQ
jgi:uncharacterized protein (TIGR03000 family)